MLGTNLTAAKDLVSSRQAQQQLCGKAHMGATMPKECPLTHGASSMRVMYVAQQNVFSREFAAHINTTHADVSLIQVGSDDIFVARQVKYPAVDAVRGQTSLQVEQSRAWWRARLTTQLPLLALALRATFPHNGKKLLYYKTSTPVCVEDQYCQRNCALEENLQLHESGCAVVTALCERGATPHLRVIDAFEWMACHSPARRSGVHSDPNAPYCAWYEDGKHHPKLARAHVEAWLCDVLQELRCQ